MNAPDLISAGQLLYGKSGWKHQLAADLDVSRKTVWLWLNGSRIPRTVELAIERLIDRDRQARHLADNAGVAPTLTPAQPPASWPSSHAGGAE